MNQSLKILLVEDSEVDSTLLIGHLRKENVEFEHARVWTKTEFIMALYDFKPDLIIADHSLPQFSGMEAFHIMREEERNIPFILITGSVSEKLLTEYMKEGIDDYILKDNLLRLPSAIENVVNKKRIENLHEELCVANKKLDTAYSDMRDSINYAKKIQHAMLTDITVLSAVFPESFIFFKPKDVLSGDFFWFDLRDDFFYVAVVDCTGHGVPGALLSMMGNSMLNETVNALNIYEPAEILDSLNKRVQHVLKHDKTEFRDGMDIGLCCIHLKTYRMIFSGANHPVVVIRKNELIEIKADKPAVGAADVYTHEYATQQIALEKGDRVFLFSDGYSDQFNPLSDKKMTLKRLKQLLVDTSVLPMHHQEKAIEQFFYEWKGDSEQIDDVLIIGIEI
ncbi:MAG: PP2C family protein-serine/threonine phosphatase [Flavobacteriales bacterium]